MIARAAYVIAALSAVIFTAASPARGQPRDQLTTVALSPAPLDDLARAFAICTGRMSAELADRWLMGDGGAEIEALRDRLAELTEAALQPQSAIEARALRIEARAAQADLLSRARFGLQPRIRERAAETAARLIAPCRALGAG